MSSNINKIEPVSKLYAKAVFELANEKNELDAVLVDFEKLIEAFEEQPQIMKALSAYMFSNEDREKLGLEILTKMQVHATVSRLVQLMITKNRLELLPSVYTALRNFADRAKGIVRGNVTVVEQLSEAEIADLSKAFGKKLNKQVLLEPSIDKDILGGLVVQIEGKTFDGSVRTALRRLKDNLERQSI